MKEVMISTVEEAVSAREEIKNLISSLTVPGYPVDEIQIRKLKSMISSLDKVIEKGVK